MQVLALNHVRLRPCHDGSRRLRARSASARRRSAASSTTSPACRRRRARRCSPRSTSSATSAPPSCAASGPGWSGWCCPSSRTRSSRPSPRSSAARWPSRASRRCCAPRPPAASPRPTTSTCCSSTRCPASCSPAGSTPRQDAPHEPLRAARRARLPTVLVNAGDRRAAVPARLLRRRGRRRAGAPAPALAGPHADRAAPGPARPRAVAPQAGRRPRHGRARPACRSARRRDRARALLARGRRRPAATRLLARGVTGDHLRERPDGARRDPGRAAGGPSRARRRLGRGLRRLGADELHRSAADHGPPADRGDGPDGHRPPDRPDRGRRRCRPTSCCFEPELVVRGSTGPAPRPAPARRGGVSRLVETRQCFVNFLHSSVESVRCRRRRPSRRSRWPPRERPTGRNGSGRTHRRRLAQRSRRVAGPTAASPEPPATTLVAARGHLPALRPQLRRRQRRRRPATSPASGRASATCATSASTRSGSRRGTCRRSPTAATTSPTTGPSTRRSARSPRPRRSSPRRSRSGIRTIVDIVPNHVSDRHPWFQAALAAGPGSPERDRFWFRPGPRRGRRRAADRLGVELRRPDVDAHDEPRRHARRVVPAPVQRPSSRTSTGTTPTSAASTRTSSASGSTAARPGVRIDSAALLVKDPTLPEVADRPGARRPPQPGPRRAPRHLPQLARDRRRLPGHADPRRRGLAARTRSGSRATSARTSCTPPSTSTSWPARGTPPSLRASIDATLAAHAPVGAPATWVLSNHDVTRPVTRYGRDDTSFAFAAEAVRHAHRPRARARGGPGRRRCWPPRCPARCTSTRATSWGSTRSRTCPTSRSRTRCTSAPAASTRAATAAGCRCRGRATAPPFGFSPDGADRRPVAAAARRLGRAHGRGPAGRPGLDAPAVPRRPRASAAPSRTSATARLRWLPAATACSPSAAATRFICVTNLSTGARPAAAATPACCSPAPTCRTAICPADATVWLRPGPHRRPLRAEVAD